MWELIKANQRRSVVLFVFLLVLTSVQYWLLDQRVHYQ